MQPHTSLGRTVMALALPLFLLLAPLPMHAFGRHSGGDDRVAMFNTINVHESDEVGDIACMFCTVNLDGDVHGDIAVMFGTVNASTDRTISGDVATLFSTLRVGDNSHIHGDLATAMSSVQLAPSVVVDGNRATFSSGLSILVIVAPLLLLIGFAWLVIWMIRRLLYPAYYR